MRVFLVITRGSDIYAPATCGLHKTLMKYEQGTEETSSGSSEMDSTDTRRDYKYVTGATCEAKPYATLGLAPERQRNKMRGQ